MKSGNSYKNWERVLLGLLLYGLNFSFLLKRNTSLWPPCHLCEHKMLHLSLSPLAIFSDSPHGLFYHCSTHSIPRHLLRYSLWTPGPCEANAKMAFTAPSWSNLFLQQQIRGGIFKSKDTFLPLEGDGALVLVLHVNESALWLGGRAQGNYDLWIGCYVYLNTYVPQLQISTKLYKSRPLWLETAAKGRNQTHRDTWQKLSPGKL